MGCIMTKLLQKVFKEISRFPDVEQNALAKWIMEELKAEKRWEQLFAESEDALEYLGNAALAARRQGKTKLLDIDKL